MPDYLEEVRNLGGQQSKREQDPAMVVSISACNLDEAGVEGTSSGSEIPGSSRLDKPVTTAVRC